MSEWIEIKIHSAAQHREYEKLLGSKIESDIFKITKQFMTEHLDEIYAIQRMIALKRCDQCL